MKSLAELRAQPHMSISRIHVYLQCPRRYFWKYVDRIEPDFLPIAPVLRRAWRSTIADCLTRSRHEYEVPVEDLRAHLRDGLVGGAEESQVPVLFEKVEPELGAVIDGAIRMLDVFLERVALPERVLGVEVPFRLELAHPGTCEVLPVPFVGTLDAVVDESENGPPKVWQLETAKRKWLPDQLEFDLQATAQRKVARSLGHEDAEAKLVLVRTGRRPAVQVEELVRHRGDERELAELAFGVHRAIGAGADHPVRGRQCKTCPYAGACGA